MADTNYSDIVDRSHPSRASRQLPETVAKEIIKDDAEGRASLQLHNNKQVRSCQDRMRVMKAFADAYWLHGDGDDTRKGTGTGSQKDKDSAVKSRTALEWDNVFITPEEIAVLVPVPDAWMDDSDITWEEIRSEVVRAFSRKVDEA